jgi:hypothetical protein
MNLAELTSLLVFLICSIGSGAASYSSGAPWWFTIIMSVLGMAFGILVALISGRIAYRFLKIKSAGFFGFACSAGYMILPIFSLTISLFLSISIPSVIAGKFGYTSKQKEKMQTEQGAAANP